MPLEDVRQHCEQGADHVHDLVVSLVGRELAHSLDTASDAAVPVAGDPPVATWLWLTRLWPPVPPDDGAGLPLYKPGRMTRGIARNDPGAALDLLTGWAADVAGSGMATA